MQSSGAHRLDARKAPPPPTEVPKYISSTHVGSSMAPANLDSSPIDAERARKLFRQLQSDFTIRMQHPGPVYPGRFATEKAWGLGKARLLALSFPEVIEKMAQANAENGNLEFWDRGFAIFELRYLTQAGRRGAEETLVRLAFWNEDSISNMAAYQLSVIDVIGAHRDLFIALAKRGTPVGIQALSKWADSGTVSLIQQLYEQAKVTIDSGNSAGGTVFYSAEETLRKYEVLLSSDWQVRLQQKIEDPSAEPLDQAEWAMDVAKAKALPGLSDALRKRIDTDLRKGRSINPQLDQEYISNESPFALGDQWHDPALILYSEIGGRLTDLDKGRLNYLGYLGDPKKRLEELLATGK